eukprot:TRINITY_DN1524_c0_g3_i1.p1 TRINITY_DN1524_c0_g3~~TRINITY_DN1524_c0_g3_i1.p1  ORF type:complete len:464 (-),score=78.57 TRINITY_DN1524_c0_g3_i1:169-1560(-)
MSVSLNSLVAASFVRKPRGLVAARKQYRGRCSIFCQQNSSGENVVNTLKERGLVQDVTNEKLIEVVEHSKIGVYCGFDPTADSLHLGNLLGIIVLSWFQRHGHQTVALVGGATGRVGDPSGKSTERPVLQEEQIEKNIQGIKQVLTTILGEDVKVMNNLDWFGSMEFLTFLRKVGRFARVGTMIAKDSVKSRLEATDGGMSFTEFTYQLLQGYDFVHLSSNHNIQVQIGGSDQWGNITAGTDLNRKILGEDAKDCFGLTFPLLLDSEGKKFGKSEGGAVWLSSDKLSSYKFYQYLFKTSDEDVVRFLKMLTFLPLQQIQEIEQQMGQSDYIPNTAQKVLAEEVTRFVHGDQALEQAIKITQALQPGAETQLDVYSLQQIAGDAPCSNLSVTEFVGVPIADVMATIGLQKSKGAARRLIKGGGVYLNNEKIQDEGYVLSDGDLIEDKLALLAAGKKNKMLVRMQ